MWAGSVKEPFPRFLGSAAVWMGCRAHEDGSPGAGTGVRGTCGTQGCLRAPTSSLPGTPWDFGGGLQELLGSSPRVAGLVPRWLPALPAGDFCPLFVGKPLAAPQSLHVRVGPGLEHEEERRGRRRRGEEGVRGFGGLGAASCSSAHPPACPEHLRSWAASRQPSGKPGGFVLHLLLRVVLLRGCVDLREARKEGNDAERSASGWEEPRPLIAGESFPFRTHIGSFRECCQGNLASGRAGEGRGLLLMVRPSSCRAALWEGVPSWMLGWAGRAPTLWGREPRVYRCHMPPKPQMPPKPHVPPR